ncbi:hypothetical protein KUCAC02_016253, partial [Chaenocephalus aceratus]
LSLRYPSALKKHRDEREPRGNYWRRIDSFKCKMMDRWSPVRETWLLLMLVSVFHTPQVQSSHVSSCPLLHSDVGSVLAKPIDVLKLLELSDDMEGVSLESGLCTSRQGGGETDLSYKIDRIQLSAPTNQLFPDSPFPMNFSVMTTVRAVKGSQVFLLSLFDSEGTQQLGLEIGRSPVFLYESHEGQPPPELYPTFRKINLADGKWHRVAYSVEGESVTLYLDCVRLDTLELLRGHDSHVSTEGVTVFGTRLLDEEVFEGDIQQLLIVDDPRAAETYCQDYIPDCDAALPYNSILSEAEEVERKPKKHVAEEFEEFDYSDLYEDRSVSTATAGPNDTEYEIVEEREISLNTRNLPEKGEKGEPSFLGAGTRITGPPGPPGPEGETGPLGVTGSVGPRGDAGELGPSGRPGLNGADGIPGPPGNIMLIPVTAEAALLTRPRSAALIQVEILRWVQGICAGGSGSGHFAADQAGYEGTSRAARPQGKTWTTGWTRWLGAERCQWRFWAKGPHGLPGITGLNGRGKRVQTAVEVRSERTGSKGDRGFDGLPGLSGNQGHKGDRGKPGLVGSSGESGEKGSEGPNGPRGQPGDPGSRGLNGPRGRAGPQGQPGIRGIDGGQGSKGNIGAAGEVGANGQQGNPGILGFPGPQGLVGLPGEKGPQGKKGTQGLAGNDGPSGHPGREGTPGEKGLPGPLGVQGPIGYPGQRGVKGADGIRGLKGSKGEKGEDGFPGSKGEYGTKGDTGDNGVLGGRGEDGPEGPKGTTGPLGEFGQSGTSGEKGKLGVPGLPGYPGRLGPKGSDGFPGSIGTAGEKGKKGPAGQQGGAGQRVPTVREVAEGRRGQQGNQEKRASLEMMDPPGSGGERGPQGPQGRNGETGPKGTSGFHGKTGPPGPSGVVGPQGKSGETGLIGDRGHPGAPGVPGEHGLPGAAGKEGGKVGRSGFAWDFWEERSCWNERVQGEQRSHRKHRPPGLKGGSGPTGLSGGIGPSAISSVDITGPQVSGALQVPPEPSGSQAGAEPSEDLDRWERRASL